MYNEDSFATGYALGRDSGDNRNNGMWGDGAWFWIVILLIFGYGGFGNGFGGFGGQGGSNMGYDIGKLATTSDVASGFNNSAVLSSLNDLKLGQAGVQQTLCQGFGGVNTAIVQNGYETRAAITDLGYRTQDCCCQTQRAIEGVNYNMAKNTCDIIQAQNANTQRIIDHLTQSEITSLRTELTQAQAQLSQFNQTNNIVNALKMPTPVPAYITCSPYQAAFGQFNSGCGFGCGCAA